MNADNQLKIRSVAEFLATIPYVFGFHPSDSVVIVGFQGTQVGFTARHDLPLPGDDEEWTRARADQVATQAARHAVERTAVIGYGEAARVTPAVRQTVEALARRNLSVIDQLRVTDGRYWSYSCTDPRCCPPEGTPCRPEVTVAAARATYQGQVALPDRAALAAQIAPVSGAEREAMTAATTRAEVRLHEALPRGIRRAGRAAVRAAEARYRSGRRFTDDEVAWLGAVLVDLQIRDYAWSRSCGEEWRVDLWRDVLRRVEPKYAPAPAALLSFVAWQRGGGALAVLAVQRALLAEPHYPMARLIDQVLHEGLPPTVLPADWARRGQARSPRKRRRGARASDGPRSRAGRRQSRAGRPVEHVGRHERDGRSQGRVVS